MIVRRRERIVPGLNTTSTADISFMLLIFFLVTTNMDVDKGLARQLPPVDKHERQETLVEEGTTMAIRISADNRLFVDDSPMDVAELRQRVKAFVTRVGKRHLVTLDADPMASYDVYFHVQNELVAAYNGLRDNVALKMYGRKYAALGQMQKDKVKEACPQRIAEKYNGSDAEKGGGL